MSRATISLIRAQAQNGTTASAWSRGEGRLGRPAGRRDPRHPSRALDKRAQVR